MFVLKSMNFGVKMMDSVFKMMDFVFKMMILRPGMATDVAAWVGFQRDSLEK